MGRYPITIAVITLDDIMRMKTWNVSISHYSVVVMISGDYIG
jgi:hypothetical protein